MKDDSSSDLFKQDVTCVPPTVTLVSTHHTPTPLLMGQHSQVQAAVGCCWRAVVPREHQPNKTVILCTFVEKSHFVIKQ